MPTVVVVAVAIVKVTCAVLPEPRTTDDGDHAAVAPAGRPVTVNVTGPVKPPVDEADTAKVADCPCSRLRLEGDNATEIPLTTLAVLTDVALCPPLAARVAAGTKATTSASNSARSGTPDRRKGAVRSGRWSMEALFGRNFSGGRNA